MLSFCIKLRDLSFPQLGLEENRVLVDSRVPNEYFVLREGRPGYLLKGGTEDKDSKISGLREIHGTAEEIITELLFFGEGLNHRRIFFESPLQDSYQLIYSVKDKSVLPRFLSVISVRHRKEIRELDALMLVGSLVGVELTPASENKVSDPIGPIGDGRWILNGASTNALALFFEEYLRYPVIDEVRLPGYWSGRIVKYRDHEALGSQQPLRLAGGLYLAHGKAQVECHVFSTRPQPRDK